MAHVPPRLRQTDRDLIAESIYYLKLDELRTLSRDLGLSDAGAKGILIQGILNQIGVHTEDGRAISKGRQTKFARYTGDLSPETHILPGFYTNGQAMRSRFTALVGPHFSFTNYGMEWIREQWISDRYPTYEEFASYWQGEHDRRKEGGEFASLQTNARVRFFRAHRGDGLSREALDAAWQEERQRRVAEVRRLLGMDAG